MISCPLCLNNRIFRSRLRGFIERRKGSRRVHPVDPLSDPRWERLIRAHPRATVFHTRGWLQALKHFYGYLPVAFTTSAPHECLRNAAVFCEVQTWLTRRRLVSLPFSDHCEPLMDDQKMPRQFSAT